MFWLIWLIWLSALILCFIIYAFYANNFSMKVIFGIASIIFFGALLAHTTSRYGLFEITKDSRSYSTCNWLIIDKSGGGCERHWILKDCIVKVDGDKCYFFSKQGMNIISGDFLVVEISDDFETFFKHYKKTYNIPKDQDAIDPVKSFAKVIKQEEEVYASRENILFDWQNKLKKKEKSLTNREKRIIIKELHHD